MVEDDASIQSHEDLIPLTSTPNRFQNTQDLNACKRLHSFSTILPMETLSFTPDFSALFLPEPLTQKTLGETKCLFTCHSLD